MRASSLRVQSYELCAVTDVWTGDAGTAQLKQANRLILTGLLGSIRWWFEVLVRGLGGSPCDPSSNQKTCLNEQHCVACELFGCTGWARKFRFDVRNTQGAIITSKLTKGTTFHVRFAPLRAVKAEEWALLELTLRLISEFGALGGKTVLKPSNQKTRGEAVVVRWRLVARGNPRRQQEALQLQGTRPHLRIRSADQRA